MPQRHLGLPAFLLALLIFPGWKAARAAVNPEIAMARPPAACASPGISAWPGLTLQNGVVTGAAILNEIDGYARIAGTIGGLGGRLAEVTSPLDYNTSAGDKAIPGTLRYIVDQAAKTGAPVWIVFNPAAGPLTITLKAPIRLGSNETIDGSCADVTLNSVPAIGLLYVLGVRNVLIDRLRLYKTDYVSGLPNDELNDAITIKNGADGVAVLHNELFDCGDGCIDTTTGVGAAVPDQARVTVAFNYIHDHDKNMLFGTLNCAAGGACTAAEAARNAALGPGLYMTMEGNALIRDAQRNPRVFGRAMLHAFNNYIAFQPHARPDAEASASYGILVSNGARALIEHDWLIPLDPKKQEAVFTAGTPGTSVSAGDQPGMIRLAGGPQAPATAIIARSAPQDVPQPFYTYIALPLETMAPGQALACIATRAGRAGAAFWTSPACF